MTAAYRKKPITISAIQYTATPENLLDIREFTGMELPVSTDLVIKTLEGEMLASPGDWIIKGVNGEFYPCKPDIFAKTYEQLDSSKMDFGVALANLHLGRKVRRSGWNGKGMYVTLMPGYPDGIEVNEVTRTAHNLPPGAKLRYQPYFQLFTTSGDVAMWTPSVSDTLAKDWEVAE